MAKSASGANIGKQRVVTGAYTSNDVSFLRRDKTIDDSGNPIPGARGGRGREISNIEEEAERGNGGSAPVREARFGGGAMSRPVSSGKAKRYDPI